MSATQAHAPALLSARELGRRMGVTNPKVMAMFRDGIIPAEIAEGVLIRFDEAKVRRILARRAERTADAAVAKANQPAGLPPKINADDFRTISKRSRRRGEVPPEIRSEATASVK